VVAPETVKLAGYTIHVGRGLIDQAGKIARAAVKAHRWAIISDTNVAPLYAARVAATFGGARVDTFTVPAGEANKTREQWSRLTDELLAAGFARDGAIIALGGGMVGDLAGFVAATYMRGIPFVQVPTTLLAMIDASIGGKTGVDTKAGKNLVGAFHDPVVVIADPETLKTVPLRELAAGSVEAIKHGVIADAKYFEQTAAELPGALADPAGEAMQRIILGSVRIKAAVVAADPKEQGLRKTLNFGHTIGHFLELATDFELLHGEAVAIGMLIEAQLAENLGVAEPGTGDAIERALPKHVLSSEPEYPGAILERSQLTSTYDLLTVLHADKKSRAGVVEFALPKRIGMMAAAGKGWAIPVPDDAIAGLYPKG
jgi:3-dehydroquinate synthase